MSSPPPSATSPTGPSFTLPQKRPSLSNLAGSSSQKRRKPSFASTSSHPLRQTSFPPPGAASPNYSPSRQASFSPSVSSGPAGRGGASTGKRRKQQGRASSQAADSASKAGGDDSRSRREADTAAGQDDEEGDDDDDAGDAENTLLEASGLAPAGSKEESENLAMLMEAFNEDQEERYAAYRRVKLKKEVVRRIVNQTLSQSVPASIVTTINGFTKVFIGDLIETARDVQGEWLAAKALMEKKRDANGAGEQTNGTSESTANTKNPMQVDERDRGPLTPDHLREALRRYKKDREGGSVGFQGLSIQGVDVAASRNGGRRLFR